jgi:hypothetical protein
VTLVLTTLIVPTYIYGLLERLREAYAREQEASLERGRAVAQPVADDHPEHDGEERQERRPADRHRVCFSPYWRDNPFLVVTLVLTTLIVPTYIYGLLERLWSERSMLSTIRTSSGPSRPSRRQAVNRLMAWIADHAHRTDLHLRLARAPARGLCPRAGGEPVEVALPLKQVVTAIDARAASVETLSEVAP